MVRGDLNVTAFGEEAVGRTRCLEACASWNTKQRCDKGNVVIFHVRTCNGQSIHHHKMEQNECGVGSLLALVMQYYSTSCYFIFFFHPTSLESSLDIWFGISELCCDCTFYPAKNIKNTWSCWISFLAQTAWPRSLASRIYALFYVVFMFLTLYQCKD